MNNRKTYKKWSYQWVLLLLCFFSMIRTTFFMYDQSLRYIGNLLQIGVGLLVIGIYVLTACRNGMVSSFSCIVILKELLVLFSAWFNGTDINECFINSISILAILFSVEMAAKKSYKRTVKVLFYTVTAYATIDFVLLLVTGRMGTFPQYLHQLGTPVYIMNGKFMSSYLQITWTTISLCMLSINKNTMKKDGKWKPFVYIYFVGLGIVNLYVPIYMHCTTGIIMSLILWGMLIFPKTQEIANSERKFLTILLALNAAIVVFQVTTRSTLFTNIVTNVFNRSVTLTNRTIIYSHFFEAMSGSYLFGKGYGTIVAAGSSNAQNSILQALGEGGIFNAGLLLFMIFTAVKRIGIRRHERISQVLFCSLSAFVLASIVEIVFSSLLVYYILALCLNINYLHKEYCQDLELLTKGRTGLKKQRISPESGVSTYKR